MCHPFSPAPKCLLHPQTCAKLQFWQDFNVSPVQLCLTSACHGGCAIAASLSLGSEAEEEDKELDRTFTVMAVKGSCRAVDFTARKISAQGNGSEIQTTDSYSLLLPLLK